MRPRVSNVIESGWRISGSPATSSTSNPSATSICFNASCGETALTLRGPSITAAKKINRAAAANRACHKQPQKYIPDLSLRTDIICGRRDAVVEVYYQIPAGLHQCDRLYSEPKLLAG